VKVREKTVRFGAQLHRREGPQQTKNFVRLPLGDIPRKHHCDLSENGLLGRAPAATPSSTTSNADDYITCIGWEIGVL
jgi:hypothetical protein